MHKWLYVGMVEETEDKNFTLRMPGNLRQAITDIAEQTSRSLSKATILLLWRGIEAFRADGVLVDTRPHEGLQNVKNKPANTERSATGGRKRA
jgi:hypothetical protein